MQLDIRGLDIHLTDALKEHVQKQLKQALARSAAQMNTVHVYLNDINGPHGGIDKRCQIEVAFHGGGTTFVEDVNEDLYVAISRAAARLKRVVRKRSDRRRPTERGPRISTSGLPT